MPASAHNKPSGSPPKKPVTERPDVPENLRRLDRLASLGLVAAHAAHEIKNGLVAVSTFVELHAAKSDDPEMAALVRRELQRINGLVTQMLRFAVPVPSPRHAVKIHELLDRSLRLLEHQMSGQAIVLQRDYAAKTNTVPGDEALLQQAFMNLLLNAVEAIGQRGKLHLATGNHTDAAGRRWLQLCLRDSGPGIAAEHLPRMFEPFFTTKKNGTGLGLSICRQAVEAHHGHIEIQSQPGSGTSFIIRLPVT